MTDKKSLFDRVTDPNRILKLSGLTPLQKALMCDETAKVHKLLKKGADPNFAGIEGQNYLPLALAIQKKNESAVKALLKAGAKPDGFIEAESYLYQAMASPTLNLMQLLLEHKANPHIRNHWTEETALFGIKQPIDHIIRQLVKKYKLDINAVDRDGCTAFFKAVDNGQLSLARVLLSCGADPDITPDHRQSVLVIALIGTQDEMEQERYWKFVKHLVLNGCDANVTDSRRRTLMHYALQFEDLDAIKLATRKTTNYLDRDIEGATPLHTALGTYNLQVIGMVLSLYTDLPTDQNMLGQTVMDALVNDDVYRYAREWETYEIIEAFLKKGGHPDTKDELGRGLIHYAIESDNRELLALLLRHEADINLTDSYGQYALQMAVDQQDLELVDLLLDADADPNITDDRGWTILDNLSKENDRTSPMVQRLIAGGGRYIKQLPASDHILHYESRKTPENMKKISKINPIRPAHNDDELPPGRRPIRAPRRK